VICTNRRVEIADYAFIAHEVVIADCESASPAWPTGGELIDSEIAPRPAVRIGENAWIGARAILLAGASIGKGSIVGAASVIDFPVPPFSVAAGNPARIVKTISVS
jgi:acetyltransferase-like isoleucine patch superfamily enzyme